MNSTPNDLNPEQDRLHDEEAKLTAFVLGELADDDADALRQAMAGDEGVRGEVESLRDTVGALSGALRAEPAPGLTDEQREAIERGEAAEPEPPVIFSFVRSRRFLVGAGLAAAACVAVMLSLPLMLTDGEMGKDYAIANAPAPEEKEVRLGQPESAEGADLGFASIIDDSAVAEWGTGPEPALLGVEMTLTDGDNIDALRDAVVVADMPVTFNANTTDRITFGQGAGETVHTMQEKTIPRNRPDAGRASRSARPGFGGDGATATGVRGAAPRPTAPARTAQRPPPPKMPAPWMMRRARVAVEDRTEASEPAIAGALVQPLTPAQVAQLSEQHVNQRLPKVAEGRKRARKAGDSQLEDRFRREFELLMERKRTSKPEAFNREAYGSLIDNPFIRPDQQPLSTLSVDVDTASYANVRRMLSRGALPPKDAVRIEELINYFDYAYEPPSGDDPFSVGVEVAACPWNPEHRLARIGLKGRTVASDMRPATNLVFLVDVSGSMNEPYKLPLVQQSLKMLVEHLTADDRIALVVYAGNAGLVLPSTFCDEDEKILAAIGDLRSGGSTNGGAGIHLAYDVARKNFIEGGVNRVILCTDGDFNVGTSSQGELDRLIAEKRETGVFLSVLGFGEGNWQDARMESLSNKGNGNFAYIDGMLEAEKVLVNEMSSTLVTIAKDVKVQVEFNPTQVAGYRLIGYANRLLAAADFKDDTKDAGEIGAGHTVTVFYEIVPGEAGADAVDAPPATELRYATRKAPVENEEILAEMFSVKLRYKQPDAEVSAPLTEEVIPVRDAHATVSDATEDFRFAAAVAAFGMVLRDSEHKGDATYATILDLATAGAKEDKWRMEFVGLVMRAKQLAGE